MGNFCVLLYRCIYDKITLNQRCSMLVNLGIADFLMGVYLITISAADVLYRGEFVYHESDWRNGWLCDVCGMFSVISNETSMLFILLITLDRIIAIKFPFKMISGTTVCIAVICTWTCSIVAALIPLLSADMDGYYSASSVCVALPITYQKPVGWKYAFGVNIVFNFLVFLFIAVGQMVIYLEVRKQSARFASRRQIDDKAMIRSVQAVVITDLLCWCPIGVLGN